MSFILAVLLTVLGTPGPRDGGAQHSDISPPNVPSETTTDPRELVGELREEAPPVGIGGEAPPGGLFLRLEQPAVLGGVKSREVHLVPVSPALEQRLLAAVGHRRVHVSGMLTVRTWGGVEASGGTYLELSVQRLIHR